MATRNKIKELLLALVLVTMMLSNFCPKAQAQMGLSDLLGAADKGLETAKGILSEQYCGLTIPELLVCKPAVVGKKPPSKDCCASVAKADLSCLCDLKDTHLVARWGIDLTLAVALPATCNLDPKFHC